MSGPKLPAKVVSVIFHSCAMPHAFHNESDNPTGIAWICLSCAASSLRIIFADLPDFVLRMFPMADGLLSGGFLYIFMQAIGLLWLFAVMLVSVLLVKFVSCSLSSCLVEASAAPLTQQMVATFIHFCVVRFLVHSGKNFWVIGWESFGDFPTLHRLVTGRHSRHADMTSVPTTRDKSDSPSKKDRGLVHPATIAAGKIVTVAPGIFMLVMHLAVVFSTSYCSSYTFWKISSSDHSGPVWQWWVTGNKGFCEGPIPDPTSRLNSAIRFTVFASYTQWTTASLRLFPTWHRALYINGHWFPLVLFASFIPLSLIHIFTILPLFFGRERLYIFSRHWLEPYTVDNTMIALWMIWVAIVDVTMLQPTTIPYSGFDYSRIRGQRWHEFAMQMKCAFLFPVLLKFAWSCFYPGMGLAEAQIDFIMITISYAGLLMCVWVTCFIVVDFPRKKRMILVTLVSLGVAIFLSILANMDSLIIILIVWGHLLRKQLPWFGSTKRLAVRYKDGEIGEHRYFTFFFRLGMSVMLGLVAVLLSLMMMSYIQEEIRWYPETIHVETNDSKIESGVHLRESHVAHTVSHLHMQTTWEASGRRMLPQLTEDSNFRPQGKYAICGQFFHGLSVLDYSLVALSAYWEPSSPDFPLMLQELFPPWSEHPVTLKTVNHSRHGIMANNRRGLYWVEFEVAELNTTLIGVRGTDPTKIADYIEDIRLWTEPVAIQLLSFALPTVRLWPQGTIEGVIQGGHALLDFFRLF